MHLEIPPCNGKWVHCIGISILVYEDQHIPITVNNAEEVTVDLISII